MDKKINCRVYAEQYFDTVGGDIGMTYQLEAVGRKSDMIDCMANLVNLLSDRYEINAGALIAQIITRAATFKTHEKIGTAKYLRQSFTEVDGEVLDVIQRLTKEGDGK